MLQCPSCTQGRLKLTCLEDGLLCRTCDHCGGNWLLLADYLYWKAHRAPVSPNGTNSPPELSAMVGAIEVDDSKRMLICPVSGGLMTKYRISHRTMHRLDFSNQANGIWLDRGEWDLLKQEGLAGQLNNIFTDAWQRNLRAASTREALEGVYRRQFGKENYEKLKEVRAWLQQQHDKRTEMTAYLLAADPYSVMK